MSINYVTPEEQFEQAQGYPLEMANGEDLGDQEAAIADAARMLDFDKTLFDKLVGAGFEELARSLNTISNEVEIEGLLAESDD